MKAEYAGYRRDMQEGAYPKKKKKSVVVLFPFNRLRFAYVDHPAIPCHLLVPDDRCMTSCLTRNLIATPKTFRG
jgi:hypothetical protein